LFNFDLIFLKALKRDEKGIGQLLRTPVVWQQQDDENTSFRQCMARIRLQERYQDQQHLSQEYHLNIPILLGDDPPKANFFITLLCSEGNHLF
jgi:hypothetical protein